MLLIHPPHAFKAEKVFKKKNETKRNSIRPSTPRPANGFEALRVIEGQGVESIDAHELHVRSVSGHVEAHHDDEICKHQYAAFEVVALQYIVSCRFFYEWWVGEKEKGFR